MKVLHILDSLHRAGAEMLVLDICRNAAANGLDMCLAALGGGPLEDDLRTSGVEFIRFVRRAPLDPYVIAGLRRLIHEKNIKVIHSYQAVDAMHAYFASVNTEAVQVLSYEGHFSGLKNKLALRFLEPRVAANVSCSQGLIPWIKDQGIDTSGFRVIYNGVDVKRLEHSGETLKQELSISENSLIFGMVAHFHGGHRKDQMTMCRAFVAVANKMPDVHLVITGKAVGSEGQKKLEECQRICQEGRVTDRVHFLGERYDLAKVTNGIDVHIFSSFHEGLPIALMEAMLVQKPVIVSDIPPHLEVSQNGKYAMTFRTGDADDLAVRMLELGTDIQKRAELATNAYQFARATFSIEKHITQLKDLYRSLV